MKKAFLLCAAGVCGAAGGAVLFAWCWPYIDSFFYLKLGIFLDCDGCHTTSRALIFFFIPAGAAMGIWCAGAAVYRMHSAWSAAAAFALAAGAGGMLSAFLLQYLGGGPAAAAVAAGMSAAGTAGFYLSGWIKKQ